MLLSDYDIKQALVSQSITIENFDEARLQPASYDVLMGFDFLTFDKHKIDCIDPKTPIGESMQKVTLTSPDDYFILHPNEVVLGVTYDRIGVNQSYACQIMGKSSLARLGLIVHTTAGFIDPGNTLNITLELVNVNTIPIKLYPLMKIAEVAFFELKTPSEKAYGDVRLNSKYFGANTVQESQMYKSFDSQIIHTQTAEIVNEKLNEKPKSDPNSKQVLIENEIETEITTKKEKQEKIITPKPQKIVDDNKQGELF